MFIPDSRVRLIRLCPDWKSFHQPWNFNMENGNQTQTLMPSGDLLVLFSSFIKKMRPNSLWSQIKIIIPKLSSLKTSYKDQGKAFFWACTLAACTFISKTRTKQNSIKNNSKVKFSPWKTYYVRVLVSNQVTVVAFQPVQIAQA